MNLYKESNINTSHEVLEYLANTTRIHTSPQQEWVAVSQNGPVASAINNIINGINVEQATVYIENLLKLEKYLTPQQLYDSGAFNFLLPLINMEQEYWIVRILLNIAEYGSKIEHTIDSCFQNSEFIKNLIFLMEKWNDDEYKLIQLHCVQILVNLIRNEVIGNEVMQLLYNLDFHAILFTIVFYNDENIEKESRAQSIFENKARNVKLLKYYIQRFPLDILDSLGDFISPLIENFQTFISHQQYSYQVLSVLSILIQGSANLELSLKNDFVHILITSLQNEEMIKPAYNCLWIIFKNVGIPSEIFDTLAFSNLTLNAIQKASTDSAFSKTLPYIIRALEILLPTHWGDIWDNDIVRDIIDQFEFLIGDGKTTASSFLINYCAYCDDNCRVELVDLGLMQILYESSHFFTPDILFSFFELLKHFVENNIISINPELQECILSLTKDDDENISSIAQAFYANHFITEIPDDQ